MIEKRAICRNPLSSRRHRGLFRLPDVLGIESPMPKMVQFIDFSGFIMIWTQVAALQFFYAVEQRVAQVIR